MEHDRNNRLWIDFLCSHSEGLMAISFTTGAEYGGGGRVLEREIGHTSDVEAFDKFLSILSSECDGCCKFIQDNENKDDLIYKNQVRY